MASEFVVLHEKGEERLVNLAWVEEIRKDIAGNAWVYFAFQNRTSDEQDYIRVDERYDDVKRLIWR